MLARLLVPSVLAAVTLASACGSSNTSSGDGGGSTGAVLTSSTVNPADTTSATGTPTTSVGSTVTTTTTTTASTGSSTGACGDLGDQCTQCLNASSMCQAEYCDCAADPSCQSLITCAQGCAPNDTNCSQSCFAQHEVSISKGALLDGCAATACNGKCGAVTTLNACEVCLFTSCSSQMNQCFADSNCYQIILCIQNTCAPNDTSCAQNCALQYSDGIDLAQSVGDCETSSCGSQCQ